MAAGVIPAPGQPLGTLTTVGSSGNSQVLAFAANGNTTYDITLGANTALSLTGGAAGQYQTVTALLREGATGGFVASLPTNVIWASGAMPVLATSAGSVSTLVFGTSDGGKTVVGFASGGAAIGTAAGTARDAAAALTAESAASNAAAAAAAAASSEMSRAEAAETALLPKAGTTIAGLAVSSSPTASQVAAALPSFSASTPGVVPAPGAAPNQVLGQGGWTTMTGGGNVSTDAAGTITAQLVHAATGAVNRSLGAAASDVLNVRDYGAAGTGTATAIGTTYGATLAALASYAAPGGATPFSWATNPKFGLTFTMTTSAAQSAVGTTLTFAETLSSTQGLPFQATVAAWQDPSNGNFLLQPGMLVSGACIQNGTTVAGWPTTSVRQGELLPSGTDWAASHAYAVNAIAAANGNFYQATTAGTSAASGGPTGTGAAITDGSVVWKYLKPSETTLLPSGALTLSTATSTPCAAGTAITFTIAPSQLQALTTDWLGIQAAVAQAWLQSTGGSIHIPAGSYQVNHSLMNAGGMTDTVHQAYNVELYGDGYALTQINYTADLGQDMCALAESNRGLSTGQEVSSASAYRDFRLNGPGSATLVLGVSPAKMDGICLGAGARLYRIEANGFRAGVTLVKDHQELHGVLSSKNGYGVLMAPYSDTMSDQLIEDGSLTGNAVASLGVTSSNQMDSVTMKNVHTGAGPYGFYALPSPPNVSATSAAMLSNSTLMNVWTEQVGNGWLYGSGTNANVTGNTFINTGGLSVGVSAMKISNGQGGTVPAPALIYVPSFVSNTMISTAQWPYSAVTDAVIETTNAAIGCVSNLWINDSGIATASSTSVAPLLCHGQSFYNNQFQSGLGSGVFRPASGSVSTAQPVADVGKSAMPYQDGKPFLGIAAEPAVSGEMFAVYTSSPNLYNIPLANTAQSITVGQPVFATNSPALGISGGMDQTGAIGTAASACGNGGTVCTISLGSLANSGASGAATGLTAAGTTQATAYAISSSSSQFTTVPAGSGAILGQVPVGGSVTIYNDGANALSVYPPSGAAFANQAANSPSSVPAGASAIYRRLSTNVWH